MAITITITERAGGTTHTLDARHTQMFLEELRRVRGSAFSRFIRSILGRIYSFGKTHQRVTPDLTIRVDTNGNISEFELLGDYVLKEKGEAKTYQFYFGLLLHQLL